MAKRDYKKEKSEEDASGPKLTVAHFKEITELLKKYGGRNRVLAYWHAVTLDENGNIKAVLDHSEHSERDAARFEALEPLKGIKYVGNGYLQYIPYNWCTEWLSKWEWWASENKNLPELKGLIASPDKIKNFRNNFKLAHEK